MAYFVPPFFFKGVGLFITIFLLAWFSCPCLKKWLTVYFENFPLLKCDFLLLDKQDMAHCQFNRKEKQLEIHKTSSYKFVVDRSCVEFLKKR